MAQYIQIVEEEEKYPFRMGDSVIWYRRFDQALVQKLRRKWTTTSGRNRQGEKIEQTNNDEWFNDMIDYIIG